MWISVHMCFSVGSVYGKQNNMYSKSYINILKSANIHIAQWISAKWTHPFHHHPDQNKTLSALLKPSSYTLSYPESTILLLAIIINHFFLFFFFKSLLNLLQCCFCFMFWFFGPKACGILAPWPGMEPSPHAFEGKVPTTGLPGKSLFPVFDL